ncbi:tetratricopeptide repeat protein [Streptomyces sp. RB6PN25]|uniref:Tetratricopeptide repeat protein n=1 Tax=Streptomyces humicola TaxID=2953240 RepID=A0ABT1PYW3_9ACTN|nr:tetratricopeptide repeat protein [Streptomyces humicola]MCQ4082874.1 tetratricopeptide repeat protein [Streptomyces humicola]
MAPSPPAPNTAFRRLRGDLSPGEFAAAVRRAAREIGERVSCDARYIGRVESGEIRCPNYAYERVFKHMFPGCTLTDMGFAPREAVRGRRLHADAGPVVPMVDDGTFSTDSNNEESDVLRRAFMTSGPAAALAAALPAPIGPAPAVPRRIGGREAHSVEEAVRQIRLLDDRHGAEGLFQRAGHSLRSAYALLDQGMYSQAVADRLHAGSGELAISVGWLAHDSGRHADARSYYAEALATARMSGDPALEAHAFCNTAFLARDAGRPREAVRAAQAAQRAARALGSSRLLSLLALREAGGWAGLGDRAACERALLRAARLYGKGPSDADPEWMTFYGEAELEGLEAQCWSRLGEYRRAAVHARRGVALQDPHFTRNIALYSAELAGDLAAGGEPDEAAEAGRRVLDLLGEHVRSSRIRTMLDAAATTLGPHRRRGAVAEFLARHAHSRRSA